MRRHSVREIYIGTLGVSSLSNVSLELLLKESESVLCAQVIRLSEML